MSSEGSVVAAAEIAAMLGVSRQRVTQLTAKPDFPAPLTTLTVGKIWSYADVKSWAENGGRTVLPIPAR
ncbi:MAG: DNA-binding protein [Pseudonocardiales bacterium]|nr:MAG: DNA-binding protein [Pseudonocardiales bacterium]